MKKFYASHISFLICFAAIFQAVPCLGDVLFIHDYKMKEYVIGEKEAELAAGYSPGGMFIDQKTKYTGSWMKRLFGGVEEKRETTHFLPDRNEIREIDWHREEIIVYPLQDIANVMRSQEQKKGNKELEEFLKERYQVAEPQLSIRTLPEKEKVGAYLCRQVEASLRLETKDLKKNAASITLVQQKLWVSDEVPGFAEYNDFHKKLAQKTGLDAERLGCLSFLLRYWQGSLDPVRERLNQVKGYPVKRILTVEGQYIKDVGTDSSKTHSFQIKEEFMQLREVLLEKLDESRFNPPADFRVVKN
jgi:hypothetical protein